MAEFGGYMANVNKLTSVSIYDCRINMIKMNLVNIKCIKNW